MKAPSTDQTGTKSAPMLRDVHAAEGLQQPKRNRVQLFLDDLRAEFITRGAKLNGRLSINPARDEVIAKFISSSVSDSSLMANHIGFEQAATLLLQRFERLCERVNREVEDRGFKLRIYRYLTGQLAKNVKLYGFDDPNVLVTPTLMTPIALTSLPSWLAARGLNAADSRLLYRAFSSHSQGVLEFFERGAERLDQIELIIRNDRSLAVPPYLRRFFAFARMNQGVKELLEEHAKELDRIVSSRAYKQAYGANRSIAQEILVRFGAKRAPQKLVTLKKITTSLAQDPELAMYQGRRADIIYAALSHLCFDKAKQHLLKSASLELRLIKLSKQKESPYDHKLLRTACLKSYDDTLLELNRLKALKP